MYVHRSTSTRRVYIDIIEHLLLLTVVTCGNPSSQQNMAEYYPTSDKVVIAETLAVGAGWEPHEAAINAATDTATLIAAIRALHLGLTTGTCFPAKEKVRETLNAKYAAVGDSVWTVEVAQWFLRVMQTFAAPVVPVQAYPNQFMPPPYLFTPPPSALIPVVAVPLPAMQVQQAIPIPQHNDRAYVGPVVDTQAIGSIQPDMPANAAAATAVVVEETKEQTSPAEEPDDGSAMFVSFDKVPTSPDKIKLPTAVYAAPTEGPNAYDDGSAVFVTDGKKRPRITAADVQQEIQIVIPTAQPTPETTLDMYKDGDETTTDVWCEDHEYLSTSHLNLWNNDISKIEGLKKFPNLLRLTLSSNELKNLRGINESSSIRWLDVSNNDVNSLQGLGGMPSLEWLDLHNNEFKNLSGMGELPQLTFLNMRHSDLTRLDGIGRLLPRIRYLDLSSNDLVSISGVEKCVYLTEINLNNNNLADYNEVAQLLRLPYLAHLDLSNNEFTKTAILNLKQQASSVNPKLTLIFDSGEAGVEAGRAGAGIDPSTIAGSCCLLQ